MEKIFDILKENVSEEDKGRILNVRRHICPKGDPHPICEFVKNAKFKSFYCASQNVTLFQFKEQQYLLLDENFRNELNTIGFEFEDDDGAIAQGAGMLAMAEKTLPFRYDISSLQIIERCLGVEAEADGNIAFDFDLIKKFFLPYCVIVVDNSRFALSYCEDIYRLMAYLAVTNCGKFDEPTTTRIKELLLLESSRSIAISIINGIQSSLIEYTFLQIYQCMEYLFRLNNCFMLSSMHQITLSVAIDIILAHELKISESENLCRVIKDNATESAIDNFLNVVSIVPDKNTDKFSAVAKYIYRLRCNIAHLRYQQDDISDVNWKNCIAAIIEILYSIYQKRDSEIVQVCNYKKSWAPIFKIS